MEQRFDGESVRLTRDKVGVTAVLSAVVDENEH